MQISKQKVNHALEKQVDQMFWQLVTDIKNPDDAKKVFSDILTGTELEAIKKRLAVGYWLVKKRSYENIKENLKVSSATIASVNQDVGKPGWKLALQKVMADEWATSMESKIKTLLRR